MGKINVLSFEVANLIAAGEVVDRPASAIKEMMENSIDANARHITVEIQNGGVVFMRVSDDGDGMEPDDIPLAIRRHATSKIREAKDLDGIMTLGFRGEALAAISSVSDMRIISKMKDAPYGAMLEVSGGQILGLTERGCSDGTTIIAENLFANVPARRKFLKKDVTEGMAVTANVEKVALSHPEIAVKLISDGNIKLETAGDGNLKSVIWSVFGREFAFGLIPVDGEYEGVKITGFIGRSDNVKANRNGQNFFINKRYIKSKTATAAIEQAYTAYMPPERYPVCVLFIEVNPTRVDVNVHPAKLEVKFSNEKPIFEAIYYSVKQALEADTSRPEIKPIQKKQAFVPSATDAFIPVNDGKAESLKRAQTAMQFESKDFSQKSSAPQERITAREYIDRYVNERAPGKAQTPKSSAEPINANTERTTLELLKARERELIKQTAVENTEEKPAEKTQPNDLKEDKPLAVDREIVLNENVEVVTPSVNDARIEYDIPAAKHENVPDKAECGDKPYRIVGEVFNSYIIVETGDKMLIIDKHAAHERINYERLKENMHKSDVTSQTLMLPIDVMLTSAEVGAVNNYRHEIEAIGFAFETARNTVSVHEIPNGVEPDDVQDMITVIAGRLCDGTGDAKLTRDIIFEKALFQASCKASIKAGRVYPPEYEEWVVAELMKLPDITFCPHGRPVAMEFNKRNIDHQFERN